MSAAKGSLLLVTHGIEGRPGVATAHAEALRARGVAADIRVACIKGSPGLDEALTGREPSVVIAGLTSEQRRAARAGAEVFLAGSDEKIGVVTSGQPSPTLGHPVALAHLDPAHAEPGTAVEIDIRGRRYPFTIATTPFYTRKDA